MAVPPHLLHAFRSNAPRLSREFFTCRQCLTKALQPKQQTRRWSQTINSTFSRAFTVKPSASSSASNVEGIASSPLASLSRNIGATSRSRPRFPEVSDKIVAYWLLGSAASVFGIVVFGGLTRLTESGLVDLFKVSTCLR
jgi:cytochrome c oxidase assembly protein subunit 15